MSPSDDSRAVSLTVPAKPEYILLARLALSAVCRMTALQPVDVADLKLAVTEAATVSVGGTSDSVSEDDLLSFRFRLEDERLVMEIAGPVDGFNGGVEADEYELSRAIVEATVDECDFARGTVRLVKYLTPQ
jgi:hypothetical protein